MIVGLLLAPPSGRDHGRDLRTRVKQQLGNARREFDVVRDIVASAKR